MSGYLTNLVDRTVEKPQLIRPRLTSLFEFAREDFGIAVKTSRLGRDAGVSVMEQRDQDDHEPVAPRPRDIRRPGSVTPAESALTEPASVSTEASLEVTPLRPEARAINEAPINLIPNSQPARPTALGIQSHTSPAQDVRAQTEGQSNTRTIVERTIVRDARDSTTHPSVSHLISPEQRNQSEVKNERAVVAKPRIVPRESPPTVPAREPASFSDAPNIRITIGRVDVRAIMPGADTAVSVAKRKPDQALSLDEYLKHRSGVQR